MTERYDTVAAAHYAAYRPPLHQMILGRVLSRGESFGTGLDVGCGTGYSAVSLAAHCERVLGIDPSSSMLSRASAHERVSYLCARGEQIPLPSDSVEIVTFAGSLFYCDADSAREEVSRVGREGAVVIAYDFEVLLDEVLQRLGMNPHANESDYDHRSNFSGAPGFIERMVENERVSVAISADELAHVLLSDSTRLDQFAERFRSSDPFLLLAQELRSESIRPTIEADLYYSKYQLAADASTFGHLA